MARMTLILFLAVHWVSSSRISPRVAKLEHIAEACLPCELIFGKLERTGRNGKLVQDVRVQERGEPKSGTGLMYFWASAALRHACAYLQGMFGEETYALIMVKSGHGHTHNYLQLSTEKRTAHAVRHGWVMCVFIVECNSHHTHHRYPAYKLPFVEETDNPCCASPFVCVHCYRQPARSTCFRFRKTTPSESHRSMFVKPICWHSVKRNWMAVHITKQRSTKIL